MSGTRDPFASVPGIENERAPAPPIQHDELQEKRAHYRRLVDAALDQMSIDEIRALVREMEEKLH